MENKKENIAKWAIQHFGSRLKIFEQRWAIFEKQPYYDYRVEIQIDSFQFHGRGISSSQKQSLNSSIGEALERFAIKCNEIENSSGIALHETSDKAKRAASLELIERHYVMLYSLGNISNNPIPLSKIDKKIFNLVHFFKEINIEFTFLKLNSSPYTILSLASGIKYKHSFGICFGSASSACLNSAIEKSFMEVIVNILANINQNICPMSENDFKKISFPRPQDHLLLYSNTEFAQKYLRESQHSSKKIPSLEQKLFAFSEVHYPYSSLYPVFKASHPFAIEAQWGYLKETHQKIDNLNPLFPMVLP